MNRNRKPTTPENSAPPRRFRSPAETRQYDLGKSMIEKAMSQLVRPVRIRHHTLVTIPITPEKDMERWLIAVRTSQENRGNTKPMHLIQNQCVDPAGKSTPLHRLPDKNTGMTAVLGKTGRQFPTQIDRPRIMSLIKDPQRQGWDIACGEVNSPRMGIVSGEDGILPGIKLCRVMENVRVVYLPPGFPAGIQIFRQK